MKNQILWSTDLDDMYGSKENFIKEYGDLIMANCGYESEDEITDEDIYEEFNVYNNITFDEVIDELLRHDREVRDSGEFLVLADCGRWNGRYKGGKIMSLLSALNQILDFNLYQYGVKIEILNNCLHIEGTHHDNTDSFMFYQLTPKGQQYYENQGYGADHSREVHEHLMNTKGYVRKPFYGKLGLDRWEG